MPEICLPNVYLKPHVERRIQNRLKRIEGQMRGIQRLIAEHQSCDDILIQVGAVKQAINGVAVELLEPKATRLRPGSITSFVNLPRPSISAWPSAQTDMSRDLKVMRYV